MANPQMSTHYDYIVVGCGGIGSATCYWLAKRAGKGVLGLEQFSLGHRNGGSQDHSRMIHRRYLKEHYSRLITEAYKALKTAEQEAGVTLVHHTGGFKLSPRGGAGEQWIRDMAKLLDKQGLPYEILDSKEIMRRYPQFQLGPEMMGIYCKEDGFVDAALTNSVHVQLARAHGATVLDEAPVTDIRRNKDGVVEVVTPKGLFTCGKLIVTAGAWINHVTKHVGLKLPIVVSQEQVTYCATPNIKDFTKDNFCIWSFHGDKYNFYGIPIHGNTCTKIAQDASGFVVSPETRTFQPDPANEMECLEFLAKFMPKALGPIQETRTCLYTMPPDREFIISDLGSRGWRDVIICNGAGHAFKLCGVLGRTLSELAVDGKTQVDLTPFRLDRPALNDPNFIPQYGFSRDHKFRTKAKI